MILGFTSTSKLVYRKRDMLSNANLKTKNPNLCLTTDVLCILLDFNNALVYLINFSAYYL